MSKVCRLSSQDTNRNKRVQLEKFRFRKEMRRNWFSDSMDDKWEGVSSNQVAGAKSIESFERRLDKYMVEDDNFLQLPSFSYVAIKPGFSTT